MKLIKKIIHKESRLPPKAIITLAIIAIFLFGVYGTQTAIDYTYRDRLLPGVIIGDRAFGRLTVDEARTKLQKSVDAIQEQGATFCYNDSCIEINAAFTALNDLDLSYELFTADIDGTLIHAYNTGRKGSFVKRISDQWKLSKNRLYISLEWDVDEERLLTFLTANFSEFEDPSQNTGFTVLTQGVAHTIEFQESSIGMVMNYDKALQETKEGLALLEAPRITLVLRQDYPTITKVDESRIREDALAIADSGSWKISGREREWEISKAAILNGLELGGPPNNPVIQINRENFEAYIETPKKALEQVARGAKFEIENGRVTEFQSSKYGVEVLIYDSWKIANDILQTSTSTELTFPLSIAIVPSETPNAAVNDLGINELLSAGRSNFSGSPANRRHNIAIGSASLNGLLIAPGEEFSLVAALGDIDGTTGYKEELVIKGNETILEFGGGLCQVGTTIFRTTLNSGLPITERRNHSYRVSYYEPAGTDATIYGPHPDYRFINDTGNHILIQTHIEGDELVYEFWGTKDGRVATQTTPVVYNITSPPPTKYIETLDLPVGKVKCTERAHKGADTSFDYSVAYPDGGVKDVTFNSHYRAWQEVCLIGVEKLTEPEELPTSETNELENSLN